MISLGTSIAGLWTNNDQLAVRLLESSARTGEKIWRMPMEADYRDALKSKVADLKNLGARYGGAIHAALFLQEFVEGDKPFAHVDMAGVVWDFKNGVPQGWGAQLITDWVCHEPLSDTE
jgi:leucyl aminopeptidase